jgi:hypothetical protein
MKINFEEINTNTGLGIFRKSTLLNYIKSQLEYLEAHNKNYTNKQYNAIETLKTIFKSIQE